MDNNTSLESIREKIDALDEQIMACIEQRAQLAIAIAQLKKETSQDPEFYRPEREAAILRKKLESYNGLLNKTEVSQILRDIISACRTLQQQQTIAYLGPEGTYSHASALKHFGAAVQTFPVNTIADVFQAVEKKQAHYGIVPIENSTAGVINETLDLLVDSSLYICGEVKLPIHHHLLSNCVLIKKIEDIYAHPQSFIQCQHWLNKYFPQIKRHSVLSNGQAAQKASKNPNSAAIAGDLAAQIYSLEKVYECIEDNPLNTTRFIVIGKQQVLPSGRDKTSLILTTPHTPGSLIQLMQPFAEQNINITSIESRPYQKRIWNYLFFIDIEGHREDDAVKLALKKLDEKPILYHLLGSYPIAIED